MSQTQNTTPEDKELRFLRRITSETLAPLVRRAHSRHMVVVTDWDYTLTYTGEVDNTRIFRFAGTARDEHEIVPWSLIS